MEKKNIGFNEEPRHVCVEDEIPTLFYVYRIMFREELRKKHNKIFTLMVTFGINFVYNNKIKENVHTNFMTVCRTLCLAGNSSHG